MRFCALAFLAFVAGCLTSGTKAEPPFQVYALKYAESEYPANLVNSRKAAGKVYMHWLAYLIKSRDGALTLVDCGFSDPGLVKRFRLRNFKPIVEILHDLGIAPREVQRIVLTHTHFDHALDVDLFSAAGVYVHESEAVNPEEQSLATKFAALSGQNRLHRVGHRIQVAEGLEAVHIGGHTRGSLIVRTTGLAKQLIFTGDECYFAAECVAGVALPPAAAFDRAKNQAFVRSLPADSTLLTGHEPHRSGGRWITAEIFLLD
jgi:N-acyl homoserine lactone hydrolase